MKRQIAGLLSVLGFSLVTGCVVSIGGSGSHSREEEESKSRQQIVVVPANTEDSAVMSEIDAAGKLSFESSKVSALKNIAGRASLPAAAQVHLVNTSLRALDFESSRVDVLLTLINNAAFTPAAKEAIFRQLDRLHFDSNKNQILAAIQDHAPKG